MLAVAAGFLLRAVAGGVATDVPLSRWFLTVATFGSLYIVAGKRFAEANALGDQAVHTRRCLAAYPPAYLRQMREVFAGITLLAYCLWAFQGDPAGPPWAQLSVALVTFGVMRYALLLERGEGGAPGGRHPRGPGAADRRGVVGGAVLPGRVAGRRVTPGTAPHLNRRNC